MRYVNIGGPIALFVIGAILSFALTASMPGANLDTIGYILMGASVVWLVVGLIMGASSRPATAVVHEEERRI